MIKTLDLDIQMVDLKNQYLNIKKEIDNSIQECLDSSQFIKGEKYEEFQCALASYLGVEKVIACGNGTDALQIAMMALGLKRGDEVIIPSFTYVATAEVVALLGLSPVMIDVDPDTFNISTDVIEKALSKKTKLIVPVHLYGQCADMDSINKLAKKHNLYIIEDTAQALGAKYTFSDGRIKSAGSIGDIGCTSFFPSKNLGCYGDGGAVYTNNVEIAEKIKMIANHGQPRQYTHDMVGVNSRLDNIQAAILLEKLKYLDKYNAKRIQVANAYDEAFADISELKIPYRNKSSTHVFHQYTIKITDGRRDELKRYLFENKIPSMIYYPKPLHHQKAYKNLGRIVGKLTVTEELCNQVLSLPIHTEMKEEQLNYITEKVIQFFNGK